MKTKILLRLKNFTTYELFKKNLEDVYQGMEEMNNVFDELNNNLDKLEKSLINVRK